MKWKNEWREEERYTKETKRKKKHYEINFNNKDGESNKKADENKSNERMKVDAKIDKDEEVTIK